MMFGNIVCQFFRLPKTPASHGTITASAIKKLFPSNCQVFTADARYTLYSLSSIQELLKLNYFSKMQYVAEKRDCDDYTKVLNGLMTPLIPNSTFGFVWMDVLNFDGSLDYRHACNLFISTLGVVWFVEPQANKIFSYNSKIHKPYLVVI